MNKEIGMTERQFKANDRNGNLTEFELKEPTLAEENEGERQYRVAFNRALLEGLLPKEKQKDLMKEHGIWDDEDDKKFKKVVGMLAILQSELSKAETSGDEKACASIAAELNDTRIEMWRLFLLQQSVYQNSVEGVAELIKAETIMASCVIVKSTGRRYWKDYKEFVTERDENKVSTVYLQATQIQSKIMSETTKELMSAYPETKYLKNTKEYILDNQLQQEVIEQVKERVYKAAEKHQKPKKPKKINKNELESGTDTTT